MKVSARSGTRAPARTARWLAAAAVLILFTARAPAVAAQAKPPTPPTAPEVFEKVDPYTKGKQEAFDRAGYLSLGPFSLAEGIPTKDVEEALGSVRVLWVETAHFKLGSMLQTYRRGTDDFEEKKLGEELRRLSKKLPRVRTDVRELDPWLRLHLYAQRLEEEYTDFQAIAGVTDADFVAKPGFEGSAGSMGPGKYLGCPMKFSVLLTEKSAQIDRFARASLGVEPSTWYYAALPGGSWFFGTSAEIVVDLSSLDSALHVFVATGVCKCLVTGFRGAPHARPTWFEHGLALAYGRKADPRWCVFVPRDSPGPEDDTWRWEERVNGLVTNKFAPTWDEMLDWRDSNKLEPRFHMIVWSRVTWLLEADPAGFQRYLRAIAEPAAIDESNPPGADAIAATRRKVLSNAFGKSPVELDEAWRKWVRRKYPKK